MSFRRPKPSYKRRRNVQSSTPMASIDGVPSLDSSTTLIPVPDALRQKRPRYSKDLFLPGPEELMTLPGGLALTQTIATGEASNCGFRESKGQRRRSVSETPDGNTSYANVDHIGTLTSFDSTMEGDEPRRQRRQQKQARASVKWATDVIPSLVPIYLRLLRETESLRLNPPISVSSPCLCTSFRPLTVTCLFFQRMFSIFSILYFSVIYSFRHRIYRNQCMFVFSGCTSTST
jgi:hypothetical protein